MPQRVGEFALAFDALEDGLLALGELPQVLHARLDLADDLLVESAGAFFTIAGDKGYCVPLIQQADDTLHLKLADLQVLGDAREVQFDRACRLDGRGRGRRGSRRRLDSLRHYRCPFDSPRMLLPRKITQQRNGGG